MLVDGVKSHPTEPPSGARSDVPALDSLLFNYQSHLLEERRALAAPALLDGSTVAELIEEFYKIVGARVGCCFVESNVVLTVAGLKGQTESIVLCANSSDLELLRESTAALDRHLTQIDAPCRFELVGDPFVTPAGHTVEMINIHNLHGIELNSQFSRFNCPVFNSASGWEGLREWYNQLHIWARTEIRDEMRAREVIIGIVKGYPSVCINDFIDWLESGRTKSIVDSQIAGTGIYTEASPNFSLNSSNASDPDFVRHVALAELILSSFYSSDWHRAIKRDADFLKERAQKERTAAS